MKTNTDFTTPLHENPLILDYLTSRFFSGFELKAKEDKILFTTADSTILNLLVKAKIIKEDEEMAELDVLTLIPKRTSIKKSVRDLRWQYEQESVDLMESLNAINAFSDPEVKERLSNGNVHYTDMPVLFPRGTEVIANTESLEPDSFTLEHELVREHGAHSADRAMLFDRHQATARLRERRTYGREIGMIDRRRMDDDGADALFAKKVGSLQRFADERAARDDRHGFCRELLRRIEHDLILPKRVLGGVIRQATRKVFAPQEKNAGRRRLAGFAIGDERFHSFCDERFRLAAR